MKLIRVHAYSVHPERTADTGTATAPYGGEIAINAKIAAALREAPTQSTVRLLCIWNVA